MAAVLDLGSPVYGPIATTTTTRWQRRLLDRGNPFLCSPLCAPSLASHVFSLHGWTVQRRRLKADGVPRLCAAGIYRPRGRGPRTYGPEALNVRGGYCLNTTSDLSELAFGPDLGGFFFVEPTRKKTLKP